MSKKPYLPKFKNWKTIPYYSSNLRVVSNGLRMGPIGLLEGVVAVAVAGLLLIVLNLAVFSLIVAASAVF